MKSKANVPLPKNQDQNFRKFVKSPMQFILLPYKMGHNQSSGNPIY